MSFHRVYTPFASTSRVRTRVPVAALRERKRGGSHCRPRAVRRAAAALVPTARHSATTQKEYCMKNETFMLLAAPSMPASARGTAVAEQRDGFDSKIEEAIPTRDQQIFPLAPSRHRLLPEASSADLSDRVTDGCGGWKRRWTGWVARPLPDDRPHHQSPLHVGHSNVEHLLCSFTCFGFTRCTTEVTR